MSFNLLKWCDDKISYLKQNDIEFKDGVAILPKESAYTGKVSMVSTFKYRKDIPDKLKTTSVLAYFMPDNNLFVRLRRIDKDLAMIDDYGGICGFDMSPSVGMLRPRQQLSILINSIYNAYAAVKGYKVIPNTRLGDFTTMKMSASIPEGVPLIDGKHGCNSYGFKNYGLYQLGLIVKEKKPPVLYIYGGISLKDAKKLHEFSNNSKFTIITFPDRRNRVRNHTKAHKITFKDGNPVKQLYLDNDGGDKCEC